MRYASRHNYKNISVIVVLAMGHHVPQNIFLVYIKSKKTHKRRWLIYILSKFNVVETVHLWENGETTSPVKKVLYRSCASRPHLETFTPVLPLLLNLEWCHWYRASCSLLQQTSDYGVILTHGVVQFTRLSNVICWFTIPESTTTTTATTTTTTPSTTTREINLTSVLNLSVSM